MAVLLSAFHGDAVLREAALARLERIVAADKLTGGVLIWDGEQGSVAGVLGETTDATQWQERLGLPRWFASVIDTLTQQLGPQKALDQTAGILRAALLGSDLSATGHALMCMLLSEVTATARLEKEFAQSMTEIIALHQRCMRGDLLTPGDWRKARSAAGRAVEALGPEPAQDQEPLPPELAKARIAGMAIEAAAWDPGSSPSSLSDVFRQWLQLESMKSDEEFGWTAQDFVQIQAHLQELYETYLAKNPEQEQAGNTVFDLLEKHRPEVHARLEAYQQHGLDHRVRCAERACALLRTHVHSAVSSDTGLLPTARLVE